MFLAHFRSNQLSELDTTEIATVTGIKANHLKGLFQTRFNRETLSKSELCSILDPGFNSKTVPQQEETTNRKVSASIMQPLSLLVSEFRNRLKNTHSGVASAYSSICSRKTSALNFFRIRKTLSLLGLDSKEAHIKEIIAQLGGGTNVMLFQGFKQFWAGKQYLCGKGSCLRVCSGSNYCHSHTTVSNLKAKSILEKMKLRTSYWKSNKLIKNYVDSTEDRAKSICNIRNFRLGLSQITPNSLVTDSELRNLGNYMSIIDGSSKLKIVKSSTGDMSSAPASFRPRLQSTGPRRHRVNHSLLIELPKASFVDK